MHRRGHILKLTAVSVLVGLALTGFSSKGRGHGGSDGDSSGGGGGGCSSSSQDHDSTSSSGGTSGSTYDDYDDDDDYAGTSGGSGGDYSPTPTASPAQDATVELVTCTSVRQPYATVTVTNPNAESDFFTVTVDFLDAKNRRVERGTKKVFVGGNEMERVEVDLASPDLVAKVDHCRAEPEAPTTY
ncbi:hypothetical protein SAMN04487981_102413 [Streptomyces sp. cf386]|uniref:hypothetical protein n=1 Tax=Streptomyces sp. cf386 TaxID=1761904 RepID=UPI000888B55D|nr:hypothetical protein [Streptomyces sp. cf386]SDM73425.1 hypothetical protein SAMN04487981_102413 [Streptomyces sp. cf386]